MYSKLPRELLEQIFTYPDIIKKDLLQLQLTCKQWSPVAQRHLYTIIDLEDRALYGGDKADSTQKMKERMALLTRTLLHMDIQIRKKIELIHVGFLFDDYKVTAEWLENTISIFATLVQQCPDLTSLIGWHLPVGFYKAMTDLSRKGYLQSLIHIDAPNSYLETRGPVLSSYHEAVVAFKDTLKEVSVIDGVGKTVLSYAHFQPDDLQQFPCVDHLQLKEYSRLHLFRFKDYISNCCPRTKIMTICMEDIITYTPLLDEYDDQAVITPQTQVERLVIKLTLPITANELAFVMRMFPALKDFTLKLTDDYKFDSIPIRGNMEMVVSFFKYLSRVPQVKCERMSLDPSEGLTALPYLVNPIDVEHWSIVDTFGDDLSLRMARGTQLIKYQVYDDERPTTQRSSFTIEVPMETEANLNRALEALKNKPIKSLTVKKFGTEEITEETLDYIFGTYTSLQDLELSNIQFPFGTPLVKASVAKQMRYIHLDRCDISEEYFTKLSCRFEHVDQLKYTTLLRYGYGCKKHGEKSKISIFMPHTAINMIDLDLSGWSSYTIEVWANHSYTKVDTSLDESTTNANLLEPGKATDAMCEIHIHCKSLKGIRHDKVSYKLPTSLYQFTNK